MDPEGSIQRGGNQIDIDRQTELEAGMVLVAYHEAMTKSGGLTQNIKSNPRWAWARTPEIEGKLEELVASLAKSTTAVSLGTALRRREGGFAREPHAGRGDIACRSFALTLQAHHRDAFDAGASLRKRKNDRSPAFTCLSSLLKPLLSEIDSSRRSEPTLQIQAMFKHVKTCLNTDVKTWCKNTCSLYLKCFWCVHTDLWPLMFNLDVIGRIAVETRTLAGNVGLRAIVESRFRQVVPAQSSAMSDLWYFC